jgi:hypothetical protein
MSLRRTAKTDLNTILNDSTTGFGWPITVTSPKGIRKPLTGFSDDIAQLIDPDTGQAVSGRLISAALTIADIMAVFSTEGLPKGIEDKTSKPWIVEFDDLDGNSYKFKVAKSNPDRMLGLLTMMLEFYE